MENNQTTTQPIRSDAGHATQTSPLATRWHAVTSRLQGVPFQGPVAKVNTVDCPLRPSRTT